MLSASKHARTLSRRAANHGPLASATLRRPVWLNGSLTLWYRPDITCLASEIVSDRVAITTVYMPLVRTQHPTVPWASMAGMRRKLIHDYTGVNQTVVWTTVTEDLPPLLLVLRRLLAALSAQENDPS